MGKNSRFKYEYRSNASKLHKKVGDALREHPVLKRYNIYQEYPVNKVNPDFPNGRSKIDWVIKDLLVCIEANGVQHYKFSPFFHKSEDDFRAQIKRDKEKKEAIEAAGYVYIEVRYDEELDIEEMFNRVILNERSCAKKKVKKQKREVSAELKEKQKIYRKKAYKRSKEWVKAIKKDRK